MNKDIAPIVINFKLILKNGILCNLGIKVSFINIGLKGIQVAVCIKSRIDVFENVTFEKQQLVVSKATRIPFKTGVPVEKAPTGIFQVVRKRNVPEIFILVLVVIVLANFKIILIF